MKYKALVVGAGGQGAWADAPGSGNENKIISFANALTKHEGFDFWGFCDRDHEKGLSASRAWNVQFRPALWSCPLFDVVAVATPDDTHYEVLKELVQYRPRLVICEKPLCTEVEQAREIVELYRAKGISLAVNYTRRYLPYYTALKENYQAGNYGKCLLARAAFNRGWLHTGSHAVDTFRWLGVHDVADYRHIEGDEPRIWQLELIFERYCWREERVLDDPVWPYYDRAMWHVVDNAHKFLEGKETLKCTGDDALATLAGTLEFM